MTTYAYTVWPSAIELRGNRHYDVLNSTMPPSNVIRHDWPTCQLGELVKAFAALLVRTDGNDRLDRAG